MCSLKGTCDDEQRLRSVCLNFTTVKMSSNEEMFYNNVYTLTQVVPTTKDFDGVFKKDMFRKQNTPGFMHVVRFLINIYDPSLNKKLVPWPCMCKQDEANYRKKCVEILEIIGKQNPDLPFPSGIPSCLFQATGTKYMIIMKTLSIIVLRQYLRNNVPGEKEVIQDFSMNLNEDHVYVLSQTAIDKGKTMMQKFEDDLKVYEDFKTEKKKELKQLEKAIAKSKRNLSKLLEKVVIGQEEKRKLEDYMHNEDVVEAWHKDVKESMEFIKKSVGILELLNGQMAHIFNMINLVNKPFVLDGNSLPKIDVDKVIEKLRPEFEVVARKIYVDGNLVLSNYLEVFDQLTTPIVNWVKRADFTNLEKLNLQLEASTEDGQNILQFLQNEKDRCDQLSVRLQPPETENFNHLMSDNFVNQCFSPIGRMTDFQKKEHEKKINITPIQQTCGTFFSKHKTQNSSETKPNETPKSNQIRRINAPDLMPSLNAVSAFSSGYRRKKAKNLNVTSDIYNRYSGLFASNKSICSNSNLSVMSISALPNANSTAVMNTICEEPIQAIRPFEFNTPKRRNERNYLSVPKKIAGSAEVPKIVLNEDVENSFEPNRQNLIDASVVSSSNNVKNQPEVEQVPETNSDVPKPTRRRRSISDLLNKYMAIKKNQQT